MDRNTLEALSKRQLVELHRRVFGHVGDYARLSKTSFIDALVKADAATVDAAWTAMQGTAAVIDVMPDPIAEPAPVVAPRRKRDTVDEDGAGAKLAALIQQLAGNSVNEERVRAIVADAIASQPAAATREVKIVVQGARETRIEEHTHPVFAETVKALDAGLNVLLVGPAGCGKSHLAGQVASALGRTFGTLHCTAGASESQLTGWLLPVGDGNRFEYVPSQFVRLYGEGNSLFLLDEIDAADPNMLMVINGALANGHLHVPSRYQNPEVPRGKDTSIIAAANTYGHGADMLYAGRNQLDASTLDRFYVIPMDYDLELERALAPASVLDWAWALRKRAAETKLRRVVSTRTIQKAAAMLGAGLEWEHVKSRLLAGWTRDELAKVGE